MQRTGSAFGCTTDRLVAHTELVEFQSILNIRNRKPKSPALTVERERESSLEVRAEVEA
jgi:hypothetical protein